MLQHINKRQEDNYENILSMLSKKEHLYLELRDESILHGLNRKKMFFWIHADRLKITVGALDSSNSKLRKFLWYLIGFILIS